VVRLSGQRHEPERIRCAPYRLDLGSAAIGTAGHYDAFVVVESPLPWARDASECWPFRELGWTGAYCEGADGRRWRPVVVTARGPVGASASEATPTSVTVWERTGPGGGPYRSRRWSTSHHDEVPELIRSLVDGARSSGASEAPPALHLCTHGRRDVCCGARGTTLFDDLAFLDQPAGPPGSGRPVEMWRCSHTGGHRFAPTGITFPDGLAWAHLTPPLACELTARAAAVAEQRPVPAPSTDLLAACRGVSSLPSGPAQVADRAAWAEFGWGWVDSERRVEVDGPVPAEPGAPPVTVRVDGPLGSGTVRVAVADLVPMPPCGVTGPVDPGAPTEPVWRVVSELWDR